MIAQGTITGCAGGVLFARLPAAALGDGVAITTRTGVAYGTLTALHASHAVITPHGSIDGAAVGNRVCADASALSLPLGMTALGRAFDPYGQALDRGKALRGRRVTIECGAPSAADRRAVTEPLWTGVRAIDGLLTIGRGARVGVFGAPGVGKSMLLEA
ncbi:MAG: hypothetical protein M3R53_04200, partial [Candidatus Eremiobacteraeota bacterium]|nr:hypothetical protein [Candidatus Eremiobacteraeota bacterium]